MLMDSRLSDTHRQILLELLAVAIPGSQTLRRSKWEKMGMGGCIVEPRAKKQQLADKTYCAIVASHLSYYRCLLEVCRKSQKLLMQIEIFVTHFSSCFITFKLILRNIKSALNPLMCTLPSVALTPCESLAENIYSWPLTERELISGRSEEDGGQS